MGVFDKIEDAKSSQDSNPVRPGEIWAKITECKLIEKYNKDKLMLINMTVVRVIEGEHKVGEDITHFLKTNADSFLGNVKQFVASTLGCKPEDVGQPEAERVVSEHNPMAGFIVEVKSRMIKTRAGNDFTKVHYGGRVTDEQLAEFEKAEA